MKNKTLILLNYFKYNNLEYLLTVYILQLSDDDEFHHLTFDYIILCQVYHALIQLIEC